MKVTLQELPYLANGKMVIKRGGVARDIFCFTCVIRQQKQDNATWRKILALNDGGRDLYAIFIV